MLEALNLITKHDVKNNVEHNGTEVYFQSMPTETERETLKSNGFRWSRFNKCWYISNNKITDGNVKSTNSHQENSRKTTKRNVKKQSRQPKTTTVNVNQYGVKVGDIYVNVWGYDQTNIDYYMITKILGKSMVMAHKVRPKRVHDGCSGYITTPTMELCDDYRHRENDGYFKTKVQTYGAKGHELKYTTIKCGPYSFETCSRYNGGTYWETDEYHGH